MREVYKTAGNMIRSTLPYTPSVALPLFLYFKFGGVENALLIGGTAVGLTYIYLRLCEALDRR